MTTQLQQAQAMVAAYIAAETDILLGKEVRFGTGGSDRAMKHEDLPEIRAGRKEWEARVAALQAAAAGANSIGGLSFKVANFNHSSF